MREGWIEKCIDECTEIEFGTRVVQKRDGGNTYPVYGGGGETFKMNTFNREDCLIVSRFAMSKCCVRFVSGKFFLNDSGLSVKSGKGLEQCYLNHCLFYLNDEIYNLGKGAAQRNLDVKSFKKLIIKIPPISTQLSIASELDKIIEMISKYDEQLKELDKLSQSIFYEMFGDPVENEKGWEVKKYGDVFEVGSGGTPSKLKNEYWDGGNIPWIGSNMCQNCIITATDGKFITIEGLMNSSAKLLNSGTVLVALVGATIGKVALLKTETTTNQNIAFIKVQESKDFFPEYVFFHLMNQYQDFMTIGSGKFKMANLSFIKGLNIIKAPLPLQQSFARKIEAIETMKSKVREAKKEAETLLAARMQYWFE